MSTTLAPAPIDLVAHALANGARRELLRLVRDEERSAGELAAAFPQMSRPAVSQHLGLLRRAGLVRSRADGNRRLYRAQTQGLAEMRQYLDTMWTDRLATLKAAAESAEADRRPKRSTS